MKTFLISCVIVFAFLVSAQAALPTLPYTIVDTGQIRCYNDRTEIAYPKRGREYFGQDAQYAINPSSYRDNGGGTITDLNTGLMWQADPGKKKTYAQAVAGAKKCRTGGYKDWRLPTTKELYSLILFSGTDPDPRSTNTADQIPFIDTNYFKFQYGRPADGDRVIDSQWATSTIYVGKVMNGQRAMFGVNFADGRIKGYPVDRNPRGQTKKFYVIYVRGNTEYGKNEFVDNGDKTITDKATGLMWSKNDSRKGMNWKDALAWVQEKNAQKYLGYSDWRLPTAKELQSIVDYTRSPDTTNSAAIDPIFNITPIRNEGGKKDYPFFWTSTTHVGDHGGDTADYIAFGRALGYMQDPRSGKRTLMDVHGAGAQRSDPKSGSASQYPQGRGPQGDVIRIKNYVRLVRGGKVRFQKKGPAVQTQSTRPESREGMPGMEGQRPGQDGNRQGPSGRDFVNRLDRNGDGKISRSEFDGPAKHFSHLDRNHDGYISSDEAPTGPPPRNRPTR